MSTAKARYRQKEIADFWSTPITNILQKDMDLHEQYVLEYTALSLRLWPIGDRQSRPQTRAYYTEVHKERLGRQHHCFTGWYRYWVWLHTEERSYYTEKVWRVFVSNRKGIKFEVARKYTPKQAMEAWHHYLRRMDCEDLIGITDREAWGDRLDEGVSEGA